MNFVEITEIHSPVKNMQFRSETRVLVDGKKLYLRFINNIIHHSIISIVFGHVSVPRVNSAQVSVLRIMIFYTDLNA